MSSPYGCTLLRDTINDGAHRLVVSLQFLVNSITSSKGFCEPLHPLFHLPSSSWHLPHRRTQASNGSQSNQPLQFVDPLRLEVPLEVPKWSLSSNTSQTSQTSQQLWSSSSGAQSSKSSKEKGKNAENVGLM